RESAAVTSAGRGTGNPRKRLESSHFQRYTHVGMMFALTPTPPRTALSRFARYPPLISCDRKEGSMLGYLIDMDGVIYKGSELIPGADRFIEQLRADDVPFLFLTNNSQRTRRDVATRLRRLGIDVTEEHVYTCAMATARFLAQQKPHGTAFVIGEGGL